MELADLTDRTFGPKALEVSVDGVTDFVLATGDDPNRWREAAPPGFLAVALFAVAPELLGLLYEHSVIHGDQSFTWDRPIAVGSTLEVTGAVTRARERGGVYFITFHMDVSDSDGPVGTGTAGFLAGGVSVPGESEERTEPAADDHGSPGEGQLSASRADLVRYAAATRDWNPIHWDHESAVEAGLPGVITHGLLQASWALRLACEGAVGSAPLASAKIRFRNSLPPAHPVDVVAEESGAEVKLSLSADDVEYISARIERRDE